MSRIVRLTLTILITTVFVLTFVGCGGKEPPPPPPAVKAAPNPTPKTEPPVPAPKPAESAKAEIKPATVASAPTGPGAAPVTLPLLKLVPQSSMLALALPPIAGINTKVIALAKRLAPPDVNVDDQVNEQVKNLAAKAGTPDAKSVPDIVKAKGFDPEAPLAVFADFAPTAASAKKALDVIKAGVEEAPKPAAPESTAGPAPKPAAPESTAGPAPKPAAPEGTAAPKPEAEKKAPSPEQMQKAWKSLELPAMVAVAGVADPAVAEATVKDIIAQPGSGIDAAKVEEVKEGEITIKSFDGGKCAYALAGKQMFASNSLPLIKEALARLAAPAAIRYGTPECPASAPDEAVILTRGDKIMPMIIDLAPALVALNPQMVPYVHLEALTNMASAYAGEDPIVTTLAWTEKRIQIQSRVDFSTHPGLSAMVGEVKPVRLTTLLPDNTLLAFTQRFNTQMKDNIKKNWLSALPPDLQKQGVYQQINQVLDMIGDEITIGIAGAEGIPQIYLLVGLADAEKTKSLIQLLAPMSPAGEGEGEGEGASKTPISLLAVPLPVPVYIAFPGDTLMLCNDQDKLKATVALFEKKGTTDLLKKLDPPVDPATPVITLLSIQTDLISKVIVPLSSLAGGGIPPEMQTPINRFTDTVREIRLVSSQRGTWEDGSLALYLK